MQPTARARRLIHKITSVLEMRFIATLVTLIFTLPQGRERHIKSLGPGRMSGRSAAVFSAVIAERRLITHSSRQRPECSAKSNSFRPQHWIQASRFFWLVMFLKEMDVLLPGKMHVNDYRLAANVVTAGAILNVWKSLSK